MADDITAGIACFPVMVYKNTTLTSMVHSNDHKNTRASERMVRLQANPSRAAALAKARARVGQWMAQEKLPNTGLTALRLNAGMSQKMLADLLKTKQSNVSRMEKTPGDMHFSTIKSIADALKVTVDQVCRAIEEVTTQKAKSE